MVEGSHKLTSSDLDTIALGLKGIDTWADLLRFVQELPYCRNANRTDLNLVLSEGKGTCSSKHAFLQMMAERNMVPDIKLILGMYKMNQDNTPGIGAVLTDAKLDFIPEAHCYLKVDGQRLDLTNSGSDISRIEDDILEEQEINPNQVATFKVEYHKEFVRQWIVDAHVVCSFDEVWSLREQCIFNLAQ